MAMVPQTGLRGGGVVVAVTGARAAGKSALVGSARRRLAGNRWVCFPGLIAAHAHGADATGVRIVTAQAYAEIEQAGGFAATWREDGTLFGFPAAMDEDVARGCVVVVAVPPEGIDGLRRRYDRVHVVHVSADAGAIAERVRSRGGGGVASDGLSQIRLAPPVTTIDNSGALVDAVDRFLEVLSDFVPAGNPDHVW